MSPFVMFGLVFLLVGLFLLSAFFSGSETLLFSLSPLQIQRIKNRNPVAGERLRACLADPARILSTLLVGNSLVNFAIASVGFVLTDEWFPNYGEIVAIPMMTVWLLLFGEITPKQFAMHNAEQLAPTCMRMLTFWLWLLRPFNVILAVLSRVFKKSLRRERRLLTDDELMSVVEVGEEQGVVDAEEVSMVEGILRLSELSASAEMTPRVDIEGLDLDEPEETQRLAIRTARYHYLPVYKRSLDAIEGFLNVAKVMMDPARSIPAAIEEALFIPENVTLDDLLITFQRSGKQIACVLDEYGGTAGIITRGDILELITDPVTRSTLDDVPEIKKITDDTWVIEGTVSLDEINHELGLELEADDADRLSGWVFYHAGRIPHVGQVIEAQGCRATVLRRRKRRIDTVQLEVLSYPEGDTDEELLEGNDAGYDEVGEDELK